MGRVQAFSNEEFLQRIRRVQSAMADEGLDVLLLHSPENIYYLTGHQTSGYFAYQVAIVTQTGSVRLLLRYLEHGNVEEYSWLPEADTWREGDNPVTRTLEVLKDEIKRPATVGLERRAWFLSSNDHDAIREGVAPARIVDASLLVDRLRLIKSSQEIAYLRKAGEIAEIEQRAAFEALKAGTTEADVAAAVYQAGITAGCEYSGLPHHIMSGYRYNVCHANWGPKIIRHGEMILLELYGCVERYHATQMRTVALGPPAPETNAAIEIVLGAQNNALAAMKPGASAREIDALTRAPIRQIRPDYYNRTGYSTGIGFPPRTAEWEAADFNEQHDWELEEGMVFHMLALAAGFGISETAAVTKEGIERLTPDNPRELLVK